VIRHTAVLSALEVEKNKCLYGNCWSVVADLILSIKYIFCNSLMKEVAICFAGGQGVLVCHTGPLQAMSIVSSQLTVCCRLRVPVHEQLIVFVHFFNILVNLKYFVAVSCLLFSLLSDCL